MPDLEVVAADGKKPRWTAQELLILVVGCTIAGAFVGTVGVIAWASYDTLRKMHR